MHNYRGWPKIALLEDIAAPSTDEIDPIGAIQLFGHLRKFSFEIFLFTYNWITAWMSNLDFKSLKDMCTTIEAGPKLLYWKILPRPALTKLIRSALFSYLAISESFPLGFSYSHITGLSPTTEFKIGRFCNYCDNHLPYDELSFSLKGWQSKRISKRGVLKFY